MHQEIRKLFTPVFDDLQQNWTHWFTGCPYKDKSNFVIKHSEHVKTNPCKNPTFHFPFSYSRSLKVPTLWIYFFSFLSSYESHHPFSSPVWCLLTNLECKCHLLKEVLPSLAPSSTPTPTTDYLCSLGYCTYQRLNSVFIFLIFNVYLTSSSYVEWGWAWGIILLLLVFPAPRLHLVHNKCSINIE